MRSRAALRRASSKKSENIKSVHYLLCFKHIQPLATPCFLATFSSPKWSSSFSGRGCKKKLPKDVTFASQNCEQGSQEELGWTQDGPKINPKSTFLVVQSLRAPTSDFRGAWKGVPDPISLQNPSKINAKIDKKEITF